MKRILHIGYPKTGTTSFQVQVLQALNNSGHLPNYVGTSSEKSSQTRGLVLEYLRGHSRSEVASDHAREAFEQFISCPDGFVLSMEGLVDIRRSESLRELVGRLSDIFPKDTELLLSIRDNAALLASLYQQKVKTGFEDSFETFLFGPESQGQKEASLRERFPKLVTDDLIENLLTHFKKVTVIDLNLQGYLGWLAGITNLNHSELVALVGGGAKQHPRLNPSLSRQGVRLMERFNKLLCLIPFLAALRQDDGTAKPKTNSNKTFTKSQSFVLLWAGIIKAATAKLLIVLARTLRQEKYKFPPRVEAIISETFPQSRTSLIVAAHGGAYTFTSLNTGT